MQTKPSHPAADLLPLMVGEEFDALTADIQTRGLVDAIVLHPDGSILDGRNRYRACQRLGIEPEFEKWAGKLGDETAFILSVNVRRRHLDASQRAMVAAKIALLEHGVRQSGKFAGVPTQEQTAALLNVSERTVRDAVKVRDEATPAVVKAVERGEMTVHAAIQQLPAPAPAPERLSKNGKRLPRVTAKRKEYLVNQKELAAYWTKARTALEMLGELPAASDVKKGCPAALRTLAREKTARALRWLAAFQQELNNDGDSNVS